MKKNLLLLLSLAFCIAINAQTTISNANMESWTNVGANTEEPTNFNSIKNGSGNSTAIAFAPQSCFREATNPHGGTYCARILTGNALGQGAPGSMTTGRVMVPSLQASEGYIRTIPGDANYSMPFIGKPDSLVVWYRYTKQGSDFPSITALLHVGYAYLPEVPVNGNHPDSSVNIIARAEWQGAAASVAGWTRLSIPFVYVDSRTPQYILITLTSSANSSPTTNSTLWVDDFEVIYNPTLVTNTISPLVYNVSAATGASVTVPYTITGNFTAGNVFTAQLSDASGNFTSPVNIGSVSSTTSGSIAATIPAGTASGTGYRIRVVSSTPNITAANNGDNITINLVSNSISPSAAQVIPVNTNGNTLTVTESGIISSREWKYSTVSGTGYQSFTPAQTGTTYTPNFASATTYYVICTSTWGNVTVTSNEVMITTVGNSIAPTVSQSILVGVNGNQLTVTETPAGMWREWKYSTTSGTGYQSFTPAITGAATYTPNFASAGTYYVVCYSEINGVFVYSNEVQINVGSATITTSNVAGFPYEVSPNATDLAVNVGYTTSGTFNAGNVFTAQLSDASGSFASPVNIGSVASTTSGFVSSVVPHTTAGGLGYRIRVISDNPNVTGADNGVDLQVVEFTSNVTPTAIQTIPRLTNGTVLSVNATHSYTAVWQYNAGSGYVGFATPETGQTYTPYFDIPGTYYVRCIAYNTFGDSAISNDVQIDVTNGTTLTTASVSGSPFSVSASMNAPVDVNFTSDAFFYPGNEFKVQLSDFTGSFANPVEIGSASTTALLTINATIPSSTPGSSNYRIRVVSTNPALTGSDNGADLTVNPFEISVAPATQQNILTGANGTPITVSTTQSATYEWKYSDVQGTLYVAFNPAQTGSSYTPNFIVPKTYYVVCKATNGATDVITSQDVTIVVTAPNGIEDGARETVKAYWNGNDFVVDLTASTIENAKLELMNTTGQVVVKENLTNGLNTFSTSLAKGIYVFSIADGKNVVTGKTNKQ